jgi:hypothetical protein
VWCALLKLGSSSRATRSDSRPTPRPDSGSAVQIGLDSDADPLRPTGSAALVHIGQEVTRQRSLPLIAAIVDVETAVETSRFNPDKLSDIDCSHLLSKLLIESVMLR